MLLHHLHALLSLLLLMFVLLLWLAEGKGMGMVL
jgi:hypothetical protein